MKAASEIPFVVKICGLTNEEDARIATEAGVNALGFNFYGNSPRYVHPVRARQIVAATAGEYLKVGVFVNATEHELLDVAGQMELDVIQLHGNRNHVPVAMTSRIWRSIDPVRRPPHDSRVEAYLLDTPSEKFGGSGTTFSWQLAAGFPHRFLIAGGLDANNVAEAIATARPWGVDACSRLECAPGKKDADAMRNFVRAAFTANESARAVSVL